jgi:Holliday junction resolvase RusA-like endonuclease
MKDLASRVKALGIPSSESYDIRVLGRFASDSRPDISNLFKVISDAIANGLGVDDKHFKLIDEGAQIGYLDPTLVITIVGGAS